MSYPIFLDCNAMTPFGFGRMILGDETHPRLNPFAVPPRSRKTRPGINPA
jgi:hypothetical protein